MLDQLAIGVGLTMLCISVSGFGFWIAEKLFTRHRDWLMRPPHRLKTFAVVVGAGALVLGIVLVGVAIWATGFTWLRMFGDFQTSVYFALVSYATVGYGNTMPVDDWRILGAMAAANGFINIGLLTTLLIEGLRYVREGYRKSLENDGDDEDEGD